MIYLYAIADPPAAQYLPPKALDDRPIAVWRSGSLAAVYSRHPDGMPRSSRANIRRHHQICASLMRCGAVLPVRFGTTFNRAEQLAAALEERHETLRNGLHRVRGLVEMGVRVHWDPPNPPRSIEAEAANDCQESHAPSGADSGFAYMQRRLAEEKGRRELEKRARDWADQIHAPLADHVRESKRHTLVTPAVLMSGAYLVASDQMEAFQRAVRELAQEHPDLRVFCTGPWPAYHFAPSFQAQPTP